MKHMKSILAVLGVALALCLVACGSSSDTETSVFVGSWDATYMAPVTDAEIDSDSITAVDSGSVTLEVKSDNTGTLTIVDSEYPFTWEAYDAQSFDRAIKLSSASDEGTLGILMKDEDDESLYYLVGSSDASYMIVFDAA